MSKKLQMMEKLTSTNVFDLLHGGLLKPEVPHLVDNALAVDVHAATVAASPLCVHLIESYVEFNIYIFDLITRF